jgi:hypothetical protein
MRVGYIFASLIETILIPMLPLNFFLVIASSCLDIQTARSLVFNSKEDKMKAWLLERIMPFCDDLVRVQLYNLVVLAKAKHRLYVINQILIDK